MYVKGFSDYSKGNFYRGNFISEEVIGNMLGIKEIFFKSLPTLPQIQNNFTQNGLKYYNLLPLLSIVVVTLGYIFK